MLRLFSEILKVVVWNPLTLKAINTVEFAAAALNADVVILPGTGLRAPADTDHTKWSINNKYWIVSFGRRRAPHTISSAGCAIVVRVLTPPKNQTFQGPLEKQAVQMAQSAQKHCEACGSVASATWSCAGGICAGAGRPVHAHSVPLAQQWPSNSGTTEGTTEPRHRLIAEGQQYCSTSPAQVVDEARLSSLGGWVAATAQHCVIRACEVSGIDHVFVPLAAEFSFQPAAQPGKKADGNGGDASAFGEISEDFRAWASCAGHLKRLTGGTHWCVGLVTRQTTTWHQGAQDGGKAEGHGGEAEGHGVPDGGTLD